MSKANSSARQRRAGGAVLPGQDSKPVSAPSPQVGTPQQSGLSLQQVIALIDKRLVNLETFAKGGSSTVNPVEINGLADEFNNKFEMLATEVSELKDIVLKLQSYTMEVNKTLMEERVRILSDMDGGNGMEMSVQEVSNGGEGYTMSK